MRFRIASFGRRPMPPPMLSSMCSALVVPVRATMTAGWLRTYLRKNCAHVFASNSAAHSGRGVLLARLKMRPRSKGKYAMNADLPLLGERQDLLLDAAVAHGVVGADEVDLLVAHDRLEPSANGASVGFGGKARSCTPMYRTRPSFFISLRTARYVGTSAPAPTMTRSILGTLNVANFSSICRSHGGGVGLRRRGPGQDGGGDGQGRRPEELVLNPELVGSRAGDLLPRRPAVQHVDDFAAVVDQRLEDLLDRGAIRGRPRPKLMTGSISPDDGMAR